MKILKRIGLALVGLVVLLLIIAIFTRKEYAIQKEISINKPKQQVFDFIKYQKNQEHYNPWVMMDPQEKKEYRGTDGTVGAVFAWDSENSQVGKGEQEIKAIKEGERIDIDLHFIKPFDGRAVSFLTTESTGDNQTKVIWGFNSKMNYPMNIMLVFMDIESILGKQLSNGLNNLKSTLEK